MLTRAEALMRKFPRRVRMLDRLHAKAWIADTSVLIGSANASSNGLGFESNESTRWRELGMTSNDPATVADAQAWFDQQWNAGRAIKRSDLAKARREWVKRRAMRPALSTATGHLLDAAAANPDAFAEKRIFVVVVNEDLSDEGKLELAATTEAAGIQQYAYEDWDAIPLNATLITFYNYGHGLKQDRPPVYATAPERMEGRLQFVFPRQDVLGYSVQPLSEWKARFDYLAEHKPRKWRGGDMHMELTAFIAATKDA